MGDVVIVTNESHRDMSCRYCVKYIYLCMYLSAVDAPMSINIIYTASTIFSMYVSLVYFTSVCRPYPGTNNTQHNTTISDIRHRGRYISSIIIIIYGIPVPGTVSSFTGVTR